MKIRCPNCRIKIDVPKPYIGKEIRCVECDAWLIAKKHPTLISLEPEPPATPVLGSQPPVPTEVKPITTLAYQRLRPYRKPLFALLGIVLTTATIAVYYGYLRGRKAGFNEGSSAVITIVDALSDVARDRPEPADAIANFSPPGKVKSTKWKVLEKNEFWWLISWQAQFESWKTQGVIVELDFYDQDWFLLASDYLGYKDLFAGHEYTFTNTVMLLPHIADQVAHVRLNVYK